MWKSIIAIKSLIVEIKQLFPSEQIDKRVNSDYFDSNKCAVVGPLETIQLFKEDNCSYVLEPNEPEEFPYTVLIPNSVEAIIIKSHFKDEEDNKIGWGTSSTHKIFNHV